YILFIERSIQLLRKGGLLGLVVPSNLATNLRYQKIRQYILQETRILKIINLDKKIFSNINVEPCIIFLQRFDGNKDDQGHEIYFEQLKIKLTGGFEVLSKFAAEQSRIYTSANQMLIPSHGISVSNLLEKIRNNSVFLEEFVEISRGIELGFRSQATSNKQKNSSYVPLIAGRSIQKFNITPKKRFIRFDSSNKSIFKNYALYTQPKLMLRRIGHEIVAAYDQDNLFCLCDVYILTLKPNEAISDLYFLEAILNSSLISFYLKNHFTTVKKIFPKIPIKFLKELPIRVTKDSSKILDLVDRLHKIFEEPQSFRVQYTKLMKNLNDEIFKLYELGPDEQIIINEQFKDHNKNTINIDTDKV
ncbi:MAG: TaqI-like C-terminal specificity domain-containing protein, partial [Candidatus Hodarchaeota archaeon]